MIAPWYEGESTWLGIENKVGNGGKVQKQRLHRPCLPARTLSGAPSVYPDSELEKPMHDERDAHDTDKGRNSEESVGHTTNATLSPTQTTGAMALTPEHIRARIRTNYDATKLKPNPPSAATSDYDDT
ncbi:hypothetical protein H0H87_003471 [Tephrocybe sp. NHM501043]|nr:hypothetical protein H0H87_003471 [Tephrocybe sp. NHM501043]